MINQGNTTQHFEIAGIPVTARRVRIGRYDVTVDRTGTCVATILGHRYRWFSTSYPDQIWRNVQDAAQYHALQWRNGR